MTEWRWPREDPPALLLCYRVTPEASHAVFPLMGDASHAPVAPGSSDERLLLPQPVRRESRMTQSLSWAAAFATQQRTLRRNSLGVSAKVLSDKRRTGDCDSYLAAASVARSTQSGEAPLSLSCRNSFIFRQLFIDGRAHERLLEEPHCTSPLVWIESAYSSSAPGRAPPRHDGNIEHDISRRRMASAAPAIKCRSRSRCSAREFLLATQ